MYQAGSGILQSKAGPELGCRTLLSWLATAIRSSVTSTGQYQAGGGRGLLSEKEEGEDAGTLEQAFGGKNSGRNLNLRERVGPT